MIRHDVISGRKSKDGSKTYWTKIGSAWPSEKGGMSVELEAYPLPDSEGKVRFLIVEPRDKVVELSQVQKGPAPATYVEARGMAGKPAAAAMDDQIPF